MSEKKLCRKGGNMRKPLLLFLFSALLLLSACTTATTPSTPPVQTPYRVLINGDASVDVSKVVSAITAESGKMVNIFTDQREASPAELVFGDTSREVSGLAAAALESAISDAEDADVGYAIYKTEDGSVGVVWSERESAKLAVATFAAEYASVSLLSEKPSGVIATHVFNLDDYLYEIAWADVEAEASPEVVEALKTIYEFFDGSAIVDWLASLWEPYNCVCGECRDKNAQIACYGGAFYYAISSRDNAEFLPDVESTAQALGILESNGAFDDYRDKYQNAISDRTKELIVRFCQQLQSEEDGYFYHPQWGSNVGIARSGRDLNWAIRLIEDCGAEPLYPTALDRLRGGGVSSELHLTSPLTHSAARSAVTAVSSFSDYLKDADTYMSWLRYVTRNIHENTDGAHTINSVRQQIQAAGYLEMTVDYLDQKLDELYAEMSAAYAADPVNNPRPTGLWQRHVDYNAVWGLLKLASLYSSCNRQLKYPVEAMRTCVGVILLDADEYSSYYMNDVYNQWSAASSLLANAKKYNPHLVAEMQEIAKENAPEMIANSIRKLAKFKQADGTFGYIQGTSSPYTQGVHVSLGLPEGDVNATALAGSMYRCCFTVLGYDVVMLCDYRDGARFLAEIERKTNEAYGTQSE